MQTIIFYILATLAVAGGILMVSQRNPLSGAFSLILSLVSLAGLFAMLHAEFVFILQILVYAGAIMVLVIFTIMLLNLRKEELEEAPVSWMRGMLTAVACAAAAFGAIQIFGQVDGSVAELPAGFGSMEAVGRSMLSDFIYPFEVISLILLVAIVGVVLLAKKVISMAPVGLSHFLGLSAILFFTGAFRLLFRRNLLVMLMSIELMLNAVNLSFIAFARYSVANTDGHVIAFFVMALAAAEAGIGLAILVMLFRNRATVQADDLTLMRD